MNNKGVTLIELLLVIVVLSVISGIAFLRVSAIVEQTREKVDQHNAQFVANLLSDLLDQGILEVDGTRLRNTQTNAVYSGTGRTFVRDLGDYIGNRIDIQSEEGRNKFNLTKDGFYRFRFRIIDNELQIYYYNDSKDVVVMAIVTLD